MPAVVRFNLVQPHLDAAEHSARHKAFVEMAGFAEAHGFEIVSLEEHHGADNGWSPSPLLLAGMVVGRTQRIGVSISALLAPLHDPLRVAEDLAVLDLASGGRVVTIAGLGYRPSEYAMFGRDWSARGALMDEWLETVLKAWTGEPFEHRGTTVRVTPRPLSQPHPFLLVGGTSRPAARRAARLGLPMSAAAHVPEIEAYYYEQCAAFGTNGFFASPPGKVELLHLADDPDRAWATVGHHLLHEAATYRSWQTPDIRSAVHSSASTVEELRAEGIYRILTPEQCVAEQRAAGSAAHLVLHPLCGGMPIDEGWRSLERAAAVLGQLRDRTPGTDDAQP